METLYSSTGSLTRRIQEEEEPNRRSKKKSSSSKRSTTPKGILKSNVPSTADFLRQNEELLLQHKRQILHSRSAENTLERRRSDEEEGSTEDTHHRRHRSRDNNIYATDPGSRRHHRHHRSGEKKKKKSSKSGHHTHQQDIYDRPKIPAQKISKKTSSRKPSCSSPDEGVEDERMINEDVCFYENLNFVDKRNQVSSTVEPIYNNESSLYDVPKSGNKRIMSSEILSPPLLLTEENDEREEAIYSNSEYENNQDFYDVPKYRSEEPLTTIQEGEEEAGRGEELYENYPPVTEREADDRARVANKIENIYSNECLSSSHSDRGSSGYRSSPSIQSSEELYLNENAIISEEEADKDYVEHSSSPEVRDIAIGTKSNKTKRDHGKRPLNSEEQKLRELKREKERRKALLIEQEILKKREENHKHPSESPKKPLASFKHDKEEIEPKKEGNKPVSVDFEEFDIENPPPTRRISHVPEPKKIPKVERNRSVEVYNETVRQRAPRKKTELRFYSSSSSASSSEDEEEIEKERKKGKFPSSSNLKEGGEEDMPSVQKLRSKFETDKKMGNSRSVQVRSSPEEVKPVSTAAKVFNVSQFHNNLKNGGGGKFRVMASLTRRSAVSISRALNEGSNSNVSLNNSIPNRGNNSSKSAKKSSLLSTASKAASESNKKSSSVLKKMFSRAPVSNLWDPTSLISELYEIKSSASVFQNSEDGNGQSHFEGYLDRLPSGKRKATVWNSWKTQYFVLSRGTLTAYFDESKKEAQDIFELFSGKVDRMDRNILGVQDRRGHFVVLRVISKSNNEEEEEESTDKLASKLEIHSKKDYSSTFITPGTYDVTLLTKIIVVDFGAASVRAGLASRIPTLPKIFFPSVMAVARENEREKYFGLDAFTPEVRARCDLLHPMSMDKRTVDLIAFQGMFEKIFKDLGIDDPAEYELQLSVPRSLDDRTKIAVSSVLFEEFGIRSLNMAHQAVFAMYAYQSKTGIVVDIGERMDIIPIVDGYKVGSGMSRSPVGGKELRNRTAQYLQAKNYTLSTSSPVDDYVLRAALEKSAYVARNFDRELEIYREDEATEGRNKVDYAGGKSVSLGSERFEAIEGLFKPELWDLDQAGVHVLVHKAVRECPVDVRKEVTRSIYCSGGLSAIPGFDERLELEMERLNPNVKPKVHASPYSYHAAYLGAESHALSEGFDDMKMTREVWYSSEGNHRARMWTL